MCFKLHLFWILFIQKTRWRIGWYQFCSPVVWEAQQPLCAWPHIAHGCSDQVLEGTDIQWGLYCCSVFFLLMPFQEPWVATSVCPNHHFSALHKIPLQSMAKASPHSPWRLLGAGTSFSPGFRQVPSPNHCDLVCLARNYCAPRNSAWEQAAAQHKVGWLQFKVEDGIMKFLG